MHNRLPFYFKFVLLLVPVLASASITPDWMRSATAKTQGQYPPDTKAVVLLDDTSVNVTGPGEMEITSRRVVRILRPEGRKEGDLKVYLGASDKLLGIHAWSVDQSGREFEVKEKEFVEISPFPEELYTDIKYRAAQSPASNPGSVIAFEYAVRRHTFMDQAHWFFQEDIPVSETRFTLPTACRMGIQSKLGESAFAAAGPSRTEPLAVDLH